MTDAEPQDVGSLGEEAAKLLGALSGWARKHAGDAGEGLSGLAGHAAEPAHDLHDRVATGSPECTVCPVCRTLHAVRRLSPEVTTHLSSAAASLAQAAAALMTAAEPPPRSSADVEHIDLDDEWPEGESTTP